jgi:hypothetical protein
VAKINNCPEQFLLPTHLATSTYSLGGVPRTAKSFSAEGVERFDSTALRFLPMVACLRTRRFQVFRVFEAIAAAFYHSRVAETTPWMVSRLRRTVLSWSRCPTVT